MNASSASVCRACLYLLILLAIAALPGRWFVAAEPGSPQGAASEAIGASHRPLPPSGKSDAEKLAGEALSAPEKPAQPPAKGSAADLTVWELYQKGGVLMYPITFLSVVVVCFGLERFLGLRRRKVAPAKLIAGLRDLASQSGGFDAHAAAELCRKYASPAANVIQSILAKVGRPPAELERAASEAAQREASRLYYHVRWLNLSMSVAPMLGLLGTVQGMIIVFMGVSHLPPGANKAEYMGEGIYLKLVCTFAGLAVAIPAAVLSYLFEARIQKLMSDVEDLAGELLPHLDSAGDRGRAVAPHRLPAHRT